MALPNDRALGDQLLELSGGNEAARQRNHANCERKARRDQRKNSPEPFHQGNRGHQRRSRAAEPIEQGNCLRHLDHLDAISANQAHCKTQRQADPKPGLCEQVVFVKCYEDGGSRAAGAERIARHSGFHPAHHGNTA